MWERNGTVYTCVSDAPPDVIDAMVRGFTPDRSTVEKVADYVLGPFGWTLGHERRRPSTSGAGAQLDDSC